MRLSNIFKIKGYFPFAGLLLIITGMMQTSCKKLIEVNAPVTSTNADNIFTTDATAAAVLTGVYTQMSQSGFATGSGSITLFAGLSADDFKLYSAVSNISQIAYYKNNLSVNSGGFELWNGIYPYIFICNSALQGLDNSPALTPAVKQQLTGEAKFVRAFCYFYLVNLYGDVPLALGTDFTINTALPRSSRAEVYQQIITDLKDAQNLLNDGYVKADAMTVYPTILTSVRVRPNKSAATALLARVYLYNGDYANAEAQASAVINNTSFYSLATLGNAFLKNSTEAIWQLQPVNSGWNTEDGRMFVIPASGPTIRDYPVSLSTALLNSFEPNDKRKVNGNWINSVTVGSATYVYPYKYKVGTTSATVSEYLMVLRLGEQFLIRAEAEANGAGGGINAAITDLNKIRNRAGLPDYAGATDKNAVLSALLHERQVELFAEWGHRWLDLKRTGTVDAVMSVATPLKGGTWNANWQWYPIAITELQANPNLDQNTDY